MAEPKPEYTERLEQESIMNQFLDDLQVVLDRWEAEMEADYDGHIVFTIHHPCRGEYDPQKPMVSFSEHSLWAGERKIERPGYPINWSHPTLDAFVENNYWHNPEDAIGDIRLYITKSKRSPIPEGCGTQLEDCSD